MTTNTQDGAGSQAGKVRSSDPLGLAPERALVESLKHAANLRAVPSATSDLATRLYPIDSEATLLMRQAVDAIERQAAEIARLSAENAAWRKQADTLTHQVICCGVAASHPDAELTTRGAYALRWNSAQAEDVRKLRRDRDKLRLLAIEAMPANYIEDADTLALAIACGLPADGRLNEKA